MVAWNSPLCYDMNIKSQEGTPVKMNEKILQCRKRMGLSQEELAQQLNTSRQAVSRWELGEAQPDLKNVIALAKLFGVTTDWLLLDTEDAADTAHEAQPEPEPAREPEQQPYPERPAYASSSGTDTWLEHVPGFIGRMLKKYGWIYGVYIAIGGLMFTVFGCVAMSISNSMMSYGEGFFNDFGGGFGGFGTLYDESGAVITDPSIYKALGMAVPSAAGSTTGFPNPVAAVGGLIVVTGVVMMIGGTALAIWLKRRSNQ